MRSVAARNPFLFVIAGVVAGLLWVLGYQADWNVVHGQSQLAPLPSKFVKNEEYFRCSGLETTCDLQAAKPVPVVEVGSDTLVLKVSFRGWSFPKPSYNFGLSGWSESGWRFVKAHFGVRVLEVIKNGERVARFQQPLWNTTPSTDAIDLFFFDRDTKVLYVAARGHGFLPNWINKEGFAIPIK